MAIGNLARRPLRAFNDYGARPPALWLKVVVVPLTIVMALALWDKRGAVVGVVALFVYGGTFLMATFNHSRTCEWSRRHVVLDASLVVPFAFLALACITTLSLWLCVLIGLAVGAVVVPIAVRRRGGATTT